MGHQCKAIVIGCSDFRIQVAIANLALRLGLYGKYDSIIHPGAQKAFVDEETRACKLREVAILVEAHATTEIHIVSHTDCAVYGGSKHFATLEEEKETYMRDMDATQQILNEIYPNIEVFFHMLEIQSNELVVEVKL